MRLSETSDDQLKLRLVTSSAARISVVVLTYNRCEQVLETLAKLKALPDKPELFVVDNASSDGTPDKIALAYPDVTLIAARENLGAAGRNLGVAKVTTPYVAFCDDDTWWHGGSLLRAVKILDGSPDVAVLSARVVVDQHGATDDTCLLMRQSPLDSTGLPGPSLIGYMAGASVFRTEAYRRIGGYEPRLFIGGEESLVALDILASNLFIVYADELILHHYPSPLRDSSLRRRMLARNAAWIACMRLPWREVWCNSKHAFRTMRAEGSIAADALQFLLGILWALTRRRPVPQRVIAMRAAVQLAEAKSRR